MGLDVRHVWTGVAALALVGLTGCNTSENNQRTEPDIGQMVVQIEGQDYVATQGAGGFGGVVAEIETGNAPFVVRFLRPGGGNETVITAADFEIRVAKNNSGAPLDDPIEFERTGAFTGTISGLNEGDEISVFFSLFHKTELHTDFGPYFLIIRWPESGGGGPPPL